MAEVTLNNEAIINSLRQLKNSLGDLRRPFEEIGEELVDSTKNRFVTHTAPDGSQWDSNSPVTIFLKGADNPLTGETLSLQRQITSQIDGDELQIGSTLLYAAIQQFGGTKAEFPHLWGDIPARPFLGLSSEDEIIVLEILSSYIENSIQN
ncbi:MAG: phage virion morphogenesis protein [Methylomonas sp.]|nr:MAG: phage virion morphogenesis protein [Methylomonas sp.]